MVIIPDRSCVTRPTLRGVKARGRIDGLALHMTLEQTYVNESSDVLEVVYTFPLPVAATFLGLEVELGGRRLKGAVMPRRAAEDGYENAVSGGDSAIRVERTKEGVYTLNLGNLQPNDTMRVTISYAQLLRFEQGIVRLTLPTTLASWYGDAQNQGGLHPHQVPVTGGLGDYPFSIEIEAHGPLARARASCPTHRMEFSHGVSALRASLRDKAWLDRDFVLTFDELAAQAMSVIVPDYARPEGAQATEVLIASLCPKMMLAAPGGIDLKILVDCSGSMVGASIDSARWALSQVLAELSPDDRISFGRFGWHTQMDIPRLEPATESTIRRARDVVNCLVADLGGTEMHTALTQTLAIPGVRSSAALLLITDGEVWDIDRIVDTAVRCGQRIFAIGVGAAPSESLLRTLAEGTGGACDLVPPGEDIAEAVMRMFRRIRQQTQSTVEVDWGEQPLWSAPLPRAVFAGDTVHLMAAFPVGRVPRPKLRLCFGTETLSVEAAVAERSQDADLSRLAAAQHVRALPEDEVEGWALRYQLMSAATHMLLTIERDVKAEGMPKLQKVVHTQPANLGDVVVPAVLRAGKSFRGDPVEIDYSPLPDYLSNGESSSVLSSMDAVPECEESVEHVRRCVSVDTVEYAEQSAQQDRERRAAYETAFVEVTTVHSAVLVRLVNAILLDASNLQDLADALTQERDALSLLLFGLSRRADPESWLARLLAACLHPDISGTLTRHARRTLMSLRDGLSGSGRQEYDRWAAQMHASPVAG